MSTATHRRLGLLAAALLAGSVLAMPKFAVAVDTSTPPAPPTASSGTAKPASAKKQRAKKNKKSEQQFLDKYRPRA